MPSDTPIVRQTAWGSAFPQLLVMGLLIYSFHLLRFSTPFASIYGASIYLMLSFGLKARLKKDHIEGMRLVKQRHYEDAIPAFEKSIAFFTKHPWIDKYRYLTLLDSSKVSYKEMGLANIAFCYYQTGDTKTAKDYYERLLAEFPENEMAKASLTMLITL